MFLFNQGSSHWCPYLHACGVTHEGWSFSKRKLSLCLQQPWSMTAYSFSAGMRNQKSSQVGILETYIFFYSSFCVFDCFEHIYLCPLLLFCWLIPFLLCRLALRWVSSHTATIHAVNTPLLCFHPSKYWVPGVRHFHFQYFYFQYFHFPYFFLLNFSHLLFMLISFSRDPQTALL